MDTSIEIYDALDILQFTLSEKFTEKWRHLYSPQFIRLFQLKILKGLHSSKPVKLKSLNKYFIKENGYNPNQVNQFYKDIEIDLYYPFIILK